MALSSLVALTLTPALCALLLRPRPARPAAVWRAFNRLLDGTRDGYGRLVGWMNRRPWLALAATVAAGALVAFSFTSMPKGFPAAGRSGLPVCQRAAAGGGVAGAYRSGDGPGAQAADG
ncbi:efflux RND transporter permease subunit [Klebsiella pneumoniae subsp. pneumoniae]|nr:efflux RND transporter permease subunit [Klebsiella pneumoniae subsp. pneumoniae]